MALNFSTQSLMNYGLQVTALTQFLDFKASMGGGQLTAEVALGFYSAQGLAEALEVALANADADNNYTVTINRNIAGGTQNRFIIASSGTFFSLLFGTGTHVATSISPIIGFNPVDYIGSVSYSGSTSTGTNLIPEFVPYNYLDNNNMAKVFGAVNISASGLKEAVVFNIQQFIELEFKYEPASKLQQWKTFFYWAIQQRPFDFMPQLSDPSTVFQVTLEKTEYESQGLGFRMKEMLAEFPNVYSTGAMNLRIIAPNQQFITGS